MWRVPAPPRWAGIATSVPLRTEIAISHNSCRDGHGPKRQMAARNRWVAQRQSQIPPVGYVQVVFTLPHEFFALASQNRS